MKRWFHGVREHLIFTPGGRVAFTLQIPGNRHDVQGLYALLKTEFQGWLLGDNAYWPNEARRAQLTRKGIAITAVTKKCWKFQNPSEEDALLKKWRGTIERRIGLFDRQFHAGRTLCRSRKHHEARRWAKALSHNVSRNINVERSLPEEALAHVRVVA